MGDRKQRDTAGIDCVIFGAIAGVVAFFALLIWQRADDNNLSPSEARQIIDSGISPERWWFVDHPLAAALIVFVVVTIGLRLYFFMRRLEDRNR